MQIRVTHSYQSANFDKTNKLTVKECGICGPKTKVIKTELPYVMTYLASELACMNVKMEFKFEQKDIERDCILESDKITKTEIINNY